VAFGRESTCELLRLFADFVTNRSRPGVEKTLRVALVGRARATALDLGFEPIQKCDGGHRLVDDRVAREAAKKAARLSRVARVAGRLRQDEQRVGVAIDVELANVEGVAAR